MKKQFYMVINLPVASNLPQGPIDYEAKAIQEAEAHAKRMPGTEVFVLKAIRVCKASVTIDTRELERG